MEEDWTPEQQNFVGHLHTVSKTLGRWAADQMRDGFTVEEVQQQLHDAMQASGRA